MRIYVEDQIQVVYLKRYLHTYIVLEIKYGNIWTSYQLRNAESELFMVQLKQTIFNIKLMYRYHWIRFEFEYLPNWLWTSILSRLIHFLCEVLFYFLKHFLYRHHFVKSSKGFIETRALNTYIFIWNCCIYGNGILEIL